MYCAIIDLSAAMRASLEQVLPRPFSLGSRSARFSFLNCAACLFLNYVFCVSFLCLFHFPVFFLGIPHSVCEPPSVNAPGALKWGHASLMRPRKPLPARCP